MTYMRPEDQGSYSIEFSSLLSVQREQAHQIFVKLQSYPLGHKIVSITVHKRPESH
jgi:hypothetical protein